MRKLTVDEVEEVKSIFADIEEHNFNLSQWEASFLMDLKEGLDRLDSKFMLSDRQLDLLRAIHDKLLGNSK